MTIIPYNEKYREEVHDVAIHTGSKDNLVNKQYHDFTLLMYCDPYLDHGKCFLLLDENEKVQGYILSIEDGYQFKEIMKPYFKRIHEVAPDFEYHVLFGRRASNYVLRSGEMSGCGIQCKGAC